MTVARLGGDASLWTRVGGDTVGERILTEVRDWGVRGRANVQAGASSNVSGVLVDRFGERLIASFTDHALDTDSSWLPLSEMAADIVLCDVRWPEGSLDAMSKARELGIPTVLDADLAPNDLLDTLLPLADHAVFSEPALRRFTETADSLSALQQVRRKYNAAYVGVTLGAEGYCWLGPNGYGFEKGFSVQVVDTLGAGDVFHGAYALALAEHQTVEVAARFAASAAALKCARAGGRKGIPARDEVDRLITRPT